MTKHPCQLRLSPTSLHLSSPGAGYAPNLQLGCPSTPRRGKGFKPSGNRISFGGSLSCLYVTSRPTVHATLGAFSPSILRTTWRHVWAPGLYPCHHHHLSPPQPPSPYRTYKVLPPQPLCTTAPTTFQLIFYINGDMLALHYLLQPSHPLYIVGLSYKTYTYP